MKRMNQTLPKVIRASSEMWVLSSCGRVLLLLALLLAPGFARAQSSDVPGDADYPAFSRFITQRNIFDPSRYPHETRTYHHTVSRHASSAPSFTLVGTMSYSKGNFAFFSGNSDDFKKILPVSGCIASYEVTAISLKGATLLGPDKKTIQLNIGDQLRQENNGWQMVGAAEASASSNEGASSSGGVTPDSGSTAPSANLGNNDILKRLMQLREQENK
jgi:hypothetical protein